jgi:hypothetical protein
VRAVIRLVAAILCLRWNRPSVLRRRSPWYRSSRVLPAKPVQYDGLEYAGLPVISCVFVIMLCSSVFRPQCFVDNFGQKFSESFGRFECGSSYV